MANVFKIAFPIALVLITACHSAPINYHTLMPLLPSDSADRPQSQIVIETISVPPQVDRSQLVIRQGPSNLLILENERWGASLEEELKSALADQLSRSTFDRGRSVRVEVQRFDSIPGQYARIDVLWHLRYIEKGGNSVIKTCRAGLQSPSGNTVDAVVAAHQLNIERLGAAIVQHANNLNGACVTSGIAPDPVS